MRALVRASWEHLARRPWILDALAVTAVLALLAARLVPAHWTSLWWDREFSGWVAPITHRLADGQRLYLDGGHGPMPPLPAVLLLLTAGRSGWLTESAVNFLFQALTLLCMYACLSRHLARPVPLLATLAAIPNVFSFSKAIVYDSIAQCLVALIAWQALEHLAAPTAASTAAGAWRDRLRHWRPLLLSSLATAALVLTKQSTASGALAGVVAALALTRGLDARRRVASIMVYLCVTTLSFALVSCALTPWASPVGFVVDVLQTGAEPKGGSAVLLARLGSFVLQLLRTASHSAGLYVALIAALVAAHLSRAPARGDDGAGSPAATLAYVALFFAAGATTLWIGASYSEARLNDALLLALGLTIGARLVARRPDGEREVDLLFALACVTTPAALTHSLSVTYLRWTVDNNPVVIVGLAALATFALTATRGLERAAPGRLVAGLTLVASLVLTSGRAAEQWRVAGECTVPWPEVRHLDGARLQPGAAGMRTLVARVRALAPDAGADQVLLLPEDPNVQAWFERPRPHLSSVIVFPDQYLDRYVDEDFDRLTAAPPKVIVIGPRGAWRGFCRAWNQNRGVERLLDRVQRELLPLRYLRATEHAIAYQGGLERMDVYVRAP